MPLLTASIRKLALRPATRISLLVVAGILGLVYISIGASARGLSDPETISGIAAIVSFPEGYGNLAGILSTMAGLAAAAWAGAIAGSEWSWNTLRVAIARGESRPRYILTTLAAACLLLLGGWLVLFGVGVAVAAVGGAIGGIPLGDPLEPTVLGRLPLIVAAGWWAAVLSAAIGFSAAFIARSQVVGIVVVVGLYFGEQFAGLIVPPDVLRLAPIAASSSLPGEVTRAGLSGDLLTPLALTTGYIVAAAFAAAVYARRAEIS